METLFSIQSKNVRLIPGILAVILFSVWHPVHMSASPDDWMYYMEGHQVSAMFSENENTYLLNEDRASAPSLALSCKPEVNVSLGLNGYAVLTSIMLVNAPAYPPFQYDVDIMGPLNDTAFCAQLGQELMVIVTELPTGNSCMSTVFIEDKLRPVLTCTPDTLPCNTDISSIDFEDYLDIVSDNCDPDPNVYYSYTVQTLPCNPNNFTQQISVLWTAVDASGNSTTCQDIIYLIKPPIGEIVFPPNVTVSCLNPNIDPSITGEPTYNGEPLGMSCQYMVFHSDQVVPMCNGAQKIIRLWTIMDWCTGVQRTGVQEILIIDNVPPVIICPANVTVGTSPGVCTTNYILPLPVVTDQCANSSMIDIDFFISGIPGIFSSGDIVSLGLGTTTITIRATDPCGNSRQCQYTVTVRDNTPPIPICNSLTIGVGPDGTAVLIADLLGFPIVENCGILSKEIWRMTNACNMPGDLVPGPDVLFCCEDVGDTLMVSFKVTDLSGNMNTCMFEVIVKDQIPPVAECNDITISITDQGQVIVDPSLIDDGSTDNCEIVTITVTPNAFDCDDIGINEVVLTVTDQSGNTATCTANVTVVDTVPPVALCQDVTVTLDTTGTAIITTELINNGSSDNCVIDTIFLDTYEFDCDDDGINIVTLTVTDEAGNTTTCTATVLVLTTPPVALCQDITVELDSEGNVFITPGQINDGSFDDCGIDSITVTPSFFDCSDLGNNTVTLTVYDNSGNSTTCTATVTVEDNMDPLPVCQDISVMLDAMGMVTITTDQINDGSSDNCLIDTMFLDVYDFDCDNIGENIVTLTVTDNSGNTATCTAIVTVLMPDPPVALCQDITVILMPNGIVVIVPGQIDSGSSSQCGGLLLELDQDTFDCEDLGENTVTLTVTDETGASSTCTATVTVEEGPPVANCQDITVELGIDGTVTISGSDINDNSTDDCGIADLDVTPSLFDCDDVGDHVVTLTVTDFSDLTSTCTATVTVEDNLPPVAICQDITVELDINGMVTITGSQIDGGSSDNCDSITFTVDTPTFDCADLGENTVTLTVTDEVGNTSTCTAIVVVTGTPPVANCQDITVSLNEDGIVVVFPEDIDDESTSICGEIELSLDQDTFDCEDLGTVVVTLTVTDESGATSTCTATITVVDELAPVCSAADITVFLDADGNASITADDINDGSTDNCEIDTITVTPTDFTCDESGENIVTLTVTDESGNSSTCTATVTVVDTISPFCGTIDITVSIDIEGFAIIEAADINDGSFDNCGEISLEVEPDTLGCDNLGDNTVILTVTDDAGNSSTCTATVTVDLAPPMAVCQDFTISIEADGDVTISPLDIDGGSGSNCGNLDLSLSEDTFDCTELGLNIVTLTVTDETGSSSTCTATVTITDEIDPVCSAQDITVFVDATGNVSITFSQVDDGSSDNCELESITVSTEDFTCADLGENEVTLTVTDESGNSSTCTATVTVMDTISPVCNAQDITVSINGSGEVTILPGDINDGSTDNCGPITLDVDPDTFDCDDLGENEVVLTVTDQSGNSSTCTAIVTVDESNSLEAICQNLTIFVDIDGNVSIDPEDVDNGSGGGCTVEVLTFDLSQTDFNCSDLGQNVVTLTVTDEEGNTATCTAIITVADNIPPSILCPPNVTVNCDEVTNPNETTQFGNASATDNCPGVTIQEFAMFNLNNCGVGTITRTFVATDASGNTASCVQVVTFTNSNPFTEEDITWPPSPITVNICNSTDPDDLPNGEPQFDPESLQCANPVATFMDQVQTIIDSNPNTPCKVITRTWTVTDNCQPNVSFVFVQTINVVDMVAPVFSNINNMTKVANSDCVAFFTLIASATDCAGVTITNNSPYGATTGANASGNYPIGQTIVIFTATDGCGNISTMDVIITVTDPDPTDFLCEKVVIILPEETEITLPAITFITFLPGNCTDEDDFIISYSSTNPFDTLRTYDCGDVGVTTFSLWFWNLAGTMKIDSCATADLDLRDPDDFCMDGLVLFGNVENEDGLPVSGVDVNILNAPMVPGITNGQGQYLIEGLNQSTGYEVAPFNDKNHREGVSTLDLVMIQKHLLGRAKLNSPYKMIAADANKSGHISAIDLLEIRKVILGVSTRFPNNTSWRFIDREYTFINPFLPFAEDFPETIWMDSVTVETDTADFVAIKVGDVNASYFQKVHDGPVIQTRSNPDLDMELFEQISGDHGARTIAIKAGKGFLLDGFQASVYTGGLSEAQKEAIQSDILTPDQWYYEEKTGFLHMSWSSGNAEDLTGKRIISWPLIIAGSDYIQLVPEGLAAEGYIVDDKGIEISKLRLRHNTEEEISGNEYHLYQNKPNPFSDGTVISFNLPHREKVRLVIYDLNGKEVYGHEAEYQAGRNELTVKADVLKVSGIYYYTLYTSNASFTRKMSFTIN